MAKFLNVRLAPFVPKRRMLLANCFFIVIGIYFIFNFSSSIRRPDEDNIDYTSNK